MGSSYNCKCGKCGYQISVNMGVGFAFPRLYKRTVEEMKNGKYGKKAEDFFKSFPDGAIDYDQTIAKCSSCGELFEVTSMNMYVLKPGHSIPSSKGQVWSTAAPFTDAEYITTWDLDEHYELFEKYEYTCPECGAAAETVDNAERLLMDNKLKCSKCGEGTMRAQLTMNWD